MDDAFDTAEATGTASAARHDGVKIGIVLVAIAVVLLATWRAVETRKARLSDEAALCELMTIGALKSPSSYRRISAFEDGSGLDLDVLLTFDATNPMGVAIRSHMTCSYGKGSEPVDDRLKRAIFDGEPIADPQMLKVLAMSAGMQLHKLREHEATPWGMLGL